MNYIIINGKKSSEISGLVILTLPFISKPLMRTETEEIDGRDGDYTYKLGYSATDKEMTIGLKGDYDIDEVISYFNTSGTIIFSNEPDKYYNFEMFEQIDFEKLMRFKTATVTLHVQPFKYSAVDESITISNNYLELIDYHEIEEGEGIEVENGLVSLKGTFTQGDEFMIPVKCHIKNGIFGKVNNTYSVRACLLRDEGTVSGENVAVRVCLNAPANPSTLGFLRMYLSSDGVEQDQEIYVDRDYNFLYIYIGQSGDYDMNFIIDVVCDDFNGFELINRGNIYSRPKYILFGDDVITMNVNDGNEFMIWGLLMQDEYSIDTLDMNVKRNGAYYNRYSEGDFKSLELKSGKNRINTTGRVSKIIVKDFVRWI